MAIIKETYVSERKISDVVLSEANQQPIVLNKETILKMSLGKIKNHPNGLTSVLGSLDAIMKEVQGSNDKNERKAYFKARKLYEQITKLKNKPDKDNKKKSLKERLELVKSGVFLNEESADVASLRNKISQGLEENIVLDGTRFSATILWSDSLSKSEKNFLDKYYLIGEDYSNGNYIIEDKETGVIYSLDLHNGPEINSSSINRIASSRKEISI